MQDSKTNIKGDNESSKKVESKKVEPEKTEMIAETVTASEFCDMKNIRDMIKHVAINTFGNDVKKSFDEWKKLFEEKQMMDFSNKIYFKN